jgi:phosphatidylserine/phosphatidylglycerophosphate/cardiolipin synthase-like enzyme
MYLMAITAATNSIHLASAYFVPDGLAINALVEAARRGVRVLIMTPGKRIDTHGPRSVARLLGRSARGGYRNIRISADHVPLQGSGGGRLSGVRRID